MRQNLLKTYSYLMDDGKNDKKVYGTKKSVIKKYLNFYDYKDCLINYEIMLKSQQKVKLIMYILKKSIRLH